jgi:hypothetical protein
MLDLLPPPALSFPRAPVRRELVVFTPDRPRVEQPLGVAPAWLFDYAAFVREQQDSYCQGN